MLISAELAALLRLALTPYEWSAPVPPGRVQGNPKYGLQYSALPFGFAVTRVGLSTAALFNTAGNRIVFKVCTSAYKPLCCRQENALLLFCPFLSDVT